MHRYIPITQSDKEVMLDSMGLETVDDLFQDISKDVSLQGEMDLPKALSELELMRHMEELSNTNKSTGDLTCFLGAGAYDHYIPTIVDHLAGRSEFYTSYTPYQAEISQGTLQVIFEYQTMICNLTGMDVTNASLYDGPTACVEGAMMAVEDKRRETILVSRSVDPEVRKVLKSYMKFRDVKLVEIDIQDGVTDVAKLEEAIDGDTAGVIIQNPNFFGIIEDLTEIEEIVHKNKSLFINYVDPISLGLLKSPGELGADIVVGEGQSLGNPLNYGGPYLGFLATNSRLMRKMPGRIAGQTVDKEGKRAFVLTLQAREQHIRRFKATSNICSNQALIALRATIYLTAMGKKGLREVASQSAKKAHYAFKELSQKGQYRPLFNKAFFKEFVVTTDKNIEDVNAKLLKEGILGGYNLEREYPEFKNSVLLCVTEKRTKEEIDRLVQGMGAI